MAKKKKGRRKLKKKALKYLLFIILVLAIIVSIVLNMHIKNIYVINNYYLKDIEVIKIAKIDKYPTIINANIINIKKNLENNKYIRKAEVRKKGFFNQVYITVYENYPLFNYRGETYLYNLKKDKNSSVAIVTNDIKEDKFNEFVDCMRSLDFDTLERISEIKYDPNDVDDERFYLTMNDGIYVYITLNRFDKLNDYAKIVSTLEDKKGILYLDSGEYFEVFKN